MTFLVRLKKSRSEKDQTVIKSQLSLFVLFVTFDVMLDVFVGGLFCTFCLFIVFYNYFLFFLHIYI